MNPPKARSKRKPKSVPEKVIQREILDWLATTGLLFWRQNSGIMPIPTGRKNRRGKQVFRMVHLGTEGLPDIISVLPPTGRVLGLEVKSATGRLRPGQVAFREKLEASGGIYRVVRSLDDAKEAVREWLKDTQTSPSEESLRPSVLPLLSGLGLLPTGQVLRKLTQNPPGQGTSGGLLPKVKT